MGVHIVYNKPAQRAINWYASINRVYTDKKSLCIGTVVFEQSDETIVVFYLSDDMIGSLTIWVRLGIAKP